MKRTTKSYFDKEQAKLRRYVSLFSKKYPETSKNNYPEKLVVIFERYLEVYAHAYCMDIKKERKKTAKILYNLLCGLKK